MVNLNLLKKKRPKKKIKVIDIEILFFLLALIAVAVGIFLADSMMNSKVSFMEEQVNIKQAELRRLRNVKQEIDKFKTNMSEIQSKIDIVRRLKEGQKGYYKILTNITQSLPGDVWLSGLSYEGDRIVLNCSSLRVASVNSFVMNLYETKMFSAIDLDKAAKRDEQTVEVNNFVITASVRLE